MALYAFDGTWNKDKPGADGDTNVKKFCEAYQQKSFYTPGVGTRFGKAGAIAGGITGAGGRTRVKDMLDSFKAQAKTGDVILDIVGFSRGAALALHFANAIAKKGTQLAGGVTPTIRFLGLWDTVPSFGLPHIKFNVGWDLDLPDSVVKCYHALALDERRGTFRLHRLEARVIDANQEGRLFEVWFRGVHSDVGGGNKNPGLSSVTLNWMFANAVKRGLPIDPQAIAGNSLRMRFDSPISVHDLDLIKTKFRTVRWDDRAHHSVMFRADTAKLQHNHPPENLALVDDVGTTAGVFTKLMLGV